jgi:hypothetical protein
LELPCKFGYLFAFQSISDGIIKGEFVSTHFWDELTVGEWKVRLQSINSIKVNVIKGTNISFYGTHNEKNGRNETTCKQTVPVNDSNNANREHGNSHTINDPVKPEDVNLSISLPSSVVIAIAVVVAVVVYIRTRGLPTTGNLIPPEITGQNQHQQDLQVHDGVRSVQETTV